MPKPKPAAKLNRDEIARRVFPRKVVQEAKKVARPEKKSASHLISPSNPD